MTSVPSTSIGLYIDRLTAVMLLVWQSAPLVHIYDRVHADGVRAVLQLYRALYLFDADAGAGR